MSITSAITGATGSVSHEAEVPKSEVENLSVKVENLEACLAKKEQELVQLQAKCDEDNEWWREKCRGLEEKLWYERSWRDAWKDVSISSPLTEYPEELGEPESEGWDWRCYMGSCPCCRRPLDVVVKSGQAKPFRWSQRDQGGDGASDDGENLQERYAYCCALWGANAGYALGAAVLGTRLRELENSTCGVGADRVLLHTDDVPQNYLDVLSQMWTLQEVDYIDGVEALYSSRGTNFDGVFTKLNAWNLLQYDKVLLLDLDIIPLRPLESIFQLEPPAALVRGNSDLAHGEKTDGRRFFAVGGTDVECWRQSGGINAGVILLKPCKDLFERMLSEVTSPSHPAHISGPGPEQDYLTRFFAADRRFPWHHIDVGWNYQLHHMPFALESVLQWREFLSRQEASRLQTMDCEWMPRRLAMSPEDIHIVHFSGDFKLWHMYEKKDKELQRPAAAAATSTEESNASPDQEFAERLISEFYTYKLWVAQDAPSKCYAQFGCAKSDDGRITLVTENQEDVTHIVNSAVRRIREIAMKATVAWRECSERLLAEQPALLQELLWPSVPEGCFPVGARVEVEWQPRSDGDEAPWMGGRIFSVHASGRYAVKFDQGGTWGNLERQIAPERVRPEPISEQADSGSPQTAGDP